MTLYKESVIEQKRTTPEFITELQPNEIFVFGSNLKEEAERIINEVKDGVSRWKPLAIRLGIAKREIEVFEHIYKI